MSMPTTTANWHWKNKNVTRWSREWFERELVQISTTSPSSESVSAAIGSVTEVDGDAELGQRKSKLITIFDLKIVLAWKGTASDGTEVSGKVTIPEVSHEVTVDKLSDYEYQWTCSTKSSKEVDEVFKLAKSALPPLLEQKFTAYSQALIDVHGKDLTVSGAGGSGPNCGTATPASSAPSKAAASTTSTSASASASGSGSKSSINTATVSVNASFAAPASDLFALLIDEKRIPQWTRAPAQSKPEAGGAYSLFGGGVTGTYVSLTSEKEIVQSWALSSPSWPSGHKGTLTTTLDQASDSTTVTYSLAGVPKGMEEEIKRNIEGYYVQGFKSIGLGTML